MGLCLVLAYVSTRNCKLISILWSLSQISHRCLEYCVVKDSETLFRLIENVYGSDNNDCHWCWRDTRWYTAVSLLFLTCTHLEIFVQDLKMQRCKALSFLVTFLPAVSKMAEFFSFPSSFRQRQSISRKGFCLCTLVPNLGAQLYFERNKQIYPNEVSKEQNRTVWVLDECLGPICFTFRSFGSGSTGLFLAAPHVSLSQFFFWLGLGRMRDVRKPCQLAQKLPWSAILMAKAAWPREDESVGKSVGGSGFAAQWSHSLCVLRSYSGPQCLLLPNEDNSCEEL